MANEIVISMTGTLNNPTPAPAAPQAQLKDSVSFSGKFTQVSALKYEEAISIPTSDTLITFTGVTTAGWLYMLNLDPTNYVQWGPNNAGAILVFGRMNAGEPAWMRIDSGATLRLKSNTAACIVLIKVWDN
jgi:hypothetical protein